jgi:CRISPR-associated protein Csc1
MVAGGGYKLQFLSAKLEADFLETIILNSIAAVKRLTPFFRELLQPYGLIVGENTGLSGKGEKERSLDGDLVIGTSTIDVGVNFKINFLIFESSDAGNFIQRLGRLGRHDGYHKDGQFIKFETFTAFALVPNFLVERLFQGESAPLEVNGIYDRPFFHAKIKELYRQINDFQGYYRRWGAVQSFWLYYKLGDRTIQQVPKYEEHLTPLNQQGIYITPARSISHAAVLNAWKYANNNYHVEMEKTQKNIPSFGRAKEIAPESQFEFFVISQKEIKLPKWIRLGKWMSKAELTIEQLPKSKTNEGVFTCTHPLNPLDVIFTTQVMSYDVVNMPPVSLIQNVQIQGQYYQFEDIKDLKIPVRMEYRFKG